MPPRNPTTVHHPGKTASTFATRFGERILIHRWWVILGTLVWVSMAAAGILQLDFSSSYRVFFDDDNPQLLALEALEDTYGKNENVIFLVVPDDGNATSETALSATTWLTQAAWKIPWSRRVDSLANFQYTTADNDDLYVRDLIDSNVLDNAEARSRIRAIALADPRIAGSLIAMEGDVSAVNVTIELPSDNQLTAVGEVAEFARALVQQVEEQFEGIDLRLVGTVMINQTFTEASINSQLIFLPASLLLMAVILAVITGGFSGVVATGVVMVFSILVSLGFAGWIGLPFSPPLAPVPSIVLIIVVASCVHFLTTLKQRLSAGDSKPGAIVESLRINLHPVFLASLTTGLGFLGMNFSEVPPYRHLGNIVTFGISASFLLSITLLPAMLSLIPIRSRPSRLEAGRWLGQMADFALHYRKLLLFGWSAVVVAMVLALPRNELNDVLVHFFDESVEFRQDTDFMDKHLSGNTVLDYSLEAAEPGGALDPKFLSDVSNFAEWFREQPGVRYVSVITDTFRQLNKSMHGDDPSAYRIPESRELAAQYLLLYELSLPLGLDLNNQIDDARSATRMTVSSESLYSQELLDLNARAEAWWKANAPQIAKVNNAGPATMFAYIGQRNIQAMLVGTLTVLLVVSAILLFAFRSLRVGLISIVPNLLPAVVGFGIWGLTVGQVGLSLSVIAAMTIGIVVDDTVHFLYKYLRARREDGLNPEQAIRYAFDTAGRALVTTTLVLAAGFLILAFSSFIPTAQVGILTALIIGIALVADLSLLPALLMTLDRNTKYASHGLEKK